MVLDLLSLVGLPTAIAVFEGARHQKAEEREADEQHRMKDFHIDIYCNSNSRKKDQVHGTIVVLKDHKVR
jgi:outer membrane lipoprotein-sorting protein